jgi:hypothetical protein
MKFDSAIAYFLVQHSQDSVHWDSWWSSVRKVEIKKDMYIYPNPARDVLHVQLPEPGRSRLVVFNRGWTPVRELVASGYDFSIDLHSLSPGVYYLLGLQDGQSYSKEFIIE